MEGNWTMRKFKPGSSDSKIALTVLCNSSVLVFLKLLVVCGWLGVLWDMHGLSLSPKPKQVLFH